MGLWRYERAVGDVVPSIPPETAKNQASEHSPRLNVAGAGVHGAHHFQISCSPRAKKWSAMRNRCVVAAARLRCHDAYPC